VLLAVLLAPYLRKLGKFTVPQFIGDRFYSKSASTVAVVCLLVASLTHIIGQMTGVGVAFARFLGVSKEVGVYVGMAVVFTYAVFGGMKGITYTQVAQYVVLIFAYTIPAIFISMHLTGNPIPQLGLGSDMTGSTGSLLAKLDHTVTELGFGKYTTTTAGSTLNMFVYTFSLIIGTAGVAHCRAPRLFGSSFEARRAARKRGKIRALYGGHQPDLRCRGRLGDIRRALPGAGIRYLERHGRNHNLGQILRGLHPQPPCASYQSWQEILS
jgi:Na+(H+)/acetate symporter ActP